MNEPQPRDYSSAICPHGEHIADCRDCTPNAPLTDVAALRDEVARHALLLAHRDEFIVRKGLWAEYVASIC